MSQKKTNSSQFILAVKSFCKWKIICHQFIFKVRPQCYIINIMFGYTFYHFIYNANHKILINMCMYLHFIYIRVVYSIHETCNQGKYDCHIISVTLNPLVITRKRHFSIFLIKMYTAFRRYVCLISLWTFNLFLKIIYLHDWKWIHFHKPMNLMH